MTGPFSPSMRAHFLIAMDALDESMDRVFYPRSNGAGKRPSAGKNGNRAKVKAARKQRRKGGRK